MARLTTNTTGTQPVLKISKASDMAGAIALPAIQELTITNSNGVYSYVTFDDIDTRKLSTQADNEISTNIVIDTDAYFGVATATAGSAAHDGIQKLAADKSLVYVEVYFTGEGTGKRIRKCQGFITNLAPTVSPDAPIWVTPLSIAVDGGFTDSVDA